MPDDPISAALAPVRARQGKAEAREGDTAEWLGAALKLATEDVPRLLAAVDAVLKAASRWKLYAAEGDAQDECADEIRKIIARELNGEAGA